LPSVAAASGGGTVGAITPSQHADASSVEGGAMSIPTNDESQFAAPSVPPAVPMLHELEARHITHVLEAVGGNQRRAARLLGITRWSLVGRVKKHGLRIPLVTAALLLASAFATPAGATRVQGGGNPRTDCYAELDVDGAAASGRVVRCTDGDARCDADGTANDACIFRVAVCVNQDDARPTCDPPDALTSVTPRRAAAALEVPPLASSVCGAFVDVEVPVKVRRGGHVRRPGKLHLPLVARAAVAPRVDRDDVILECLPAGTTPAAGASACPENPAGPNELVLTVKADGTDLDNGWSGASSNLPIPAGTQLTMCLAHCGDGSDPLCDATIATGAGTPNGETFGPPLPVFVAGVPTCIVNEFQSPVFNGTANLETGAIDGTIALHSHVYLTDAVHVCPRCVADRCDGGARAGAACHVDGTVFVASSLADDKTFALSKDCPPAASTVAGTLEITLPLTTGTSTLAPEPGARPQTPCVAQSGEPAGVPPAPDACRNGGQCTLGACAGPFTCARTTTDPTTGDTICVDAKGGLAQYCCSNDPGQACQPTRTGAVTRVGRAEAPRDASGAAFGAGTYPKRSDIVSVATFCEAATGTSTIDALTGLPGPGALVLPAVADWLRTTN